MKTIIAMTAAALLSAGAAQAQSASDPISVTIAYGDLDLAQAQGRKVLEARVAAAVSRVCPDRPMPQELTKIRADRTCHQTAWSSARKQLAALYDGRQLAQSAVRIAGAAN